MSALTKEGCKLPWFKTEKGVTILKVKQQYVKLPGPKKDETTTTDLNLCYYELEGNEGYYIKSISHSQVSYHS